MYLNQITGNILNKFNKQPINILYQPQKNIFDAIMSYCDLKLFIDGTSDLNIIAGNKYNTTVMHNHISKNNIFNFNVGITNNIIAYGSNKIFDMLHLNSIIFTHSHRPNRIKKEDIVLLENNLQNNVKVFFNTKIAESWRMTKNISTMNYGIPLDKFYIEDSDKNRDKILILNFENYPNINQLIQFMDSNGIKVDVATDLPLDVDKLRSIFNKYAICIDFHEHNMLNLLCAIACGCKAITYETPSTISLYSDTPNLYFTRTVQDIIVTIQQVQKIEKQDAKSYLSKKYPFDIFKENIKNMIYQLNDEAYIL